MPWVFVGLSHRPIFEIVISAFRNVRFCLNEGPLYPKKRTLVRKLSVNPAKNRCSMRTVAVTALVRRGHKKLGNGDCRTGTRFFELQWSSDDLITPKTEQNTPMLNGMMLLWFLLTAASVLFVAIDPGAADGGTAASRCEP
jgi:hypothetical protein